MKKNTFEYPKSSFFGMSKDTAIIMDKILSNPNVLKLLYYSSHPDCLASGKYNVPEGEQVLAMLGKDGYNNDLSQAQIANIPKITIPKDGIKKSYIRVTFDAFTPNASNSFYRDHIVEIKIICHFSDWTLDGYDLRPFRIAGEIDAMLDKQRLTGIGVLNFIGASQDIYDDEYGGYTLRYLADRGHEDDYPDSALQ